MISMDKIWKRLTKKSSIIFICGGLAAVSLRFLPGLIYPDYHKQYLSLSDEDAFALSQRRLSEPCAFGEKSAAAAIQRILADKGYAPAQFAEGERYRTGIEWTNAEGGTCKKDLTEARIWYKTAARQNYKPAIKALEKLSNSSVQSSKIPAPRNNKFNDPNASATNGPCVDKTKYMSMENFDSLFGVSFGKRYKTSKLLFDKEGLGVAYEFVPDKKFMDMGFYSCVVTPKSQEVCAIFASTGSLPKNDVENELRSIIRIVEKRYSVSVADLCDDSVMRALKPLADLFLKKMPVMKKGDKLYAIFFPILNSAGTPENLRALFVRTVDNNAIFIFGFDMNAMDDLGKEKEQSAVEAL